MHTILIFPFSVYSYFPFQKLILLTLYVSFWFLLFSLLYFKFNLVTRRFSAILNKSPSILHSPLSNLSEPFFFSIIFNPNIPFIYPHFRVIRRIEFRSLHSHIIRLYLFFFPYLFRVGTMYCGLIYNVKF